MGDAAQPPATAVFLGQDRFLGEGDRRHRRTEATIFDTGEIAVPAAAA
jgi:hypothetical protein